MNAYVEQKQIHGHEKQSYGNQRAEGSGREELRIQINDASYYVYKRCKQQGYCGG